MATSTMRAVDPFAGPSTLQDVVKPQFHQVPLSAENYIKNALGVRLDTDDQICRNALTPAGCPLGPQLCPLRHTEPAPSNFSTATQNAVSAATNKERERLSTVCKHWLRGLCKKGDQCEFLHEYNLRRMSECYWLVKNGYCSAGDECLYIHPKGRRVECPDYKRGFCKLGPTCPRKHVRRVACQNYLSGFCPLGPDCTRGHPKPEQPPPSAYRPRSPPSPHGPAPPGYGRYADFDRGFQHSQPSYHQSNYNSNYNSGYVQQGGQSSGNAGPQQQSQYGSGGGGAFQGGGMQPRRNLDDVLCFKCGAKGHYANHCKNRNVPGFRGGVERRYGGED